MDLQKLWGLREKKENAEEEEERQERGAAVPTLQKERDGGRDAERKGFGCGGRSSEEWRKEEEDGGFFRREERARGRIGRGRRWGAEEEEAAEEKEEAPEEEEGRKGAGGVLNLRTGAAAGAAGGLWSPAWAAAAVHLAGSRLATVLEQVWPKQVRCSVGCRLHGYHGRFSAGRCCCRCSLIHACNGRAVEFLSVAVAGGARASWTGLDGLE